jgi:hypothetical protein
MRLRSTGRWPHRHIWPEVRQAYVLPDQYRVCFSGEEFLVHTWSDPQLQKTVTMLLPGSVGPLRPLLCRFMQPVENRGLERKRLKGIVVCCVRLDPCRTF